DCFNPWLESPIHQRHLQFIFVVGDRADAANDDTGLLGHCVIDEQSTKRIDADLTPTLIDILQNFGEHLLPFLDSEEGLLLRIDQNADDYLVEEFAAALDNVQMAVGNWVKRPGVDGASHVR